MTIINLIGDRQLSKAIKIIDKKYKKNINGRFFVNRKFEQTIKGEFINVKITIKNNLPDLSLLGKYVFYISIFIMVGLSIIRGSPLNFSIVILGAIGYIILSVPKLALSKPVIFFLFVKGLRKNGYNGIVRRIHNEPGNNKQS